MRITRQTQLAVPPDLQKRADDVFAALDKLFLRPFTGELHITVISGRATELLSERDVNAPPRIP